MCSLGSSCYGHRGVYGSVLTEPLSESSWLLGQANCISKERSTKVSFCFSMSDQINRLL